MENAAALRLFPPASGVHPLSGLYLAQCIRAAARPFVYTNFIISLDGCISQYDPRTGLNDVPAAISNPHDLLLFSELAAQADVLVTTSRHLRAIAHGRQDSLVIIPPALAAWRREQGLSPQPLIAVVGEKLDLAIHRLDEALRSRLLVVTTKKANQEQIRATTKAQIPILLAGEGPRLAGNDLIKALHEYGLSYIYSIAGPGVFQALLDDQVLHRLYLTITPILLGGETNQGLLRGPALQPPQGFKMRELYFDQQLPAPTGQFFAVFDSAS